MDQQIIPGIVAAGGSIIGIMVGCLITSFIVKYQIKRQARLLLLSDANFKNAVVDLLSELGEKTKKSEIQENELLQKFRNPYLIAFLGPSKVEKIKKLTEKEKYEKALKQILGLL